jgi:hypothetical protein
MCTADERGQRKRYASISIAIWVVKFSREG